MSMEVDSTCGASSSMSLDALPKRALVFTDTRMSKLYDELLADMIPRPHWARSASPPGPGPSHKSALLRHPCLLSLPKCDGMAFGCLMCLPYEYCMTMYYSIGQPIKNTYFERASDSYLLVQSQATFLLRVHPFLIRRRFRIAFFSHVYFERIFSYWRRLFWKGAPCFKCAEVQGSGRRNEGCHQQPPATDCVNCRVVHLRCFYHTKEKNSSTKWPIHIFLCAYLLLRMKTTTTTSPTIQSADHSTNIQPWLVADTYQVRT